METKVVVYPNRGEIKAFFKSPKATNWGTFKNAKGEHILFDTEALAIQYCCEKMLLNKERGNARTVWRSGSGFNN
jgi:hypothetical protein